MLKLLRAGCHVLTTSRFPHDAALRYAREQDFGAFSLRLEIVGPLELANVPLVEAFCDAVAARFPHIHVRMRMHMYGTRTPAVAPPAPHCLPPLILLH